MIKPRGFENWNRALRGAYTKGWTHAQAGGSALDCPYHDKRKRGGQVTWSRAYLKAWQDGFSDYTHPPITED